ncbi:MAG TPA: mannitol dehydrogenase family protein [Sphingopyxis sp.]|uniref:mannitol dehydrogenase family protein n=1 Tax=Sphingopyxis sp. TaxID=1908224 RepID=UPI002C79869F|nr:mannitol dehydrogenase family protein [Sphingopyxis sp.]HWW58361.1 mannitol dehydrogenase family protein [Sphingopyxis sp.]
MRLDVGALASLPPAVQRPSYDIDAQKAGIVHFGIGAFHRAHQAVYTDDAMNAGERDWGITGVSLRSVNVAEQLRPQEGLYTVASRSGGESALRVIGAVRGLLVAPQEPQAVVEAVAAPETHIVSFTVTEKGYCRAGDGSLDPSLAGDDSIYYFLRAGLALRRESGLPGLTLLSCDNLAHNGAQLRRLTLAYLSSRDSALADWVEAHCTFPSSMVDRIVPATTASDRDTAQASLGGVRDEAHVTTEPFSQWVIEDRFAGPRPRWEAHGAELVADVASYETAKLRMLNGAHSALAYIGLMHRHDFVHQAVADPAIRPLVERLMREEAAPSIAAAPGQDLAAYAGALLARFENTALHHRLIQIAMDGSQKIPQRWLETLAINAEKGRRCPAILTAIGAWLAHVRGDNGPVDDPLSAQLSALWRRADAAATARAIFMRDGPLAGRWRPDDADIAAIAGAVSPTGRAPNSRTALRSKSGVAPT